MSRDLDLLGCFEEQLAGVAQEPTASPHARPPFDLTVFDRIALGYSGGKDSLAALLHVIELGYPKDRIVLHHHDVDGNGASSLFDYPVTRDYVRKVADHLGIRVLFSWREGGLEKEALRENCGVQPVTFTRLDGTSVTMGGERSKANTRLKFPQVTSDLRLRYCSSVAKIDVFARLLVNDPAYSDGKTLVITGERAEESANRARYASFEPHRCDNRNGRVPRWIDHWRNVLHWREQDVWAIIKRHRITPHVAYFLGMSRASCFRCVFLGPDGWATNRAMDPDGFEKMAQYEERFGVTIHRTRSLREQADRGKNLATDPYWVKQAMSKEFTAPIVMDPWVLPKGAYGANEGPT